MRLPPQKERARLAVEQLCVEFVTSSEPLPSIANEADLQRVCADWFRANLRTDEIRPFEQHISPASPRDHIYDLAFAAYGQVVAIVELKARTITLQDVRQLYRYSTSVPSVTLISLHECSLAKNMLRNIETVQCLSLWQRILGSQLRA